LEDKLSLSAILEAIRAAGTAQVQEIENRAELPIQQIKDHALEEVERIQQETRTAAVEPAYGERAKILHHARLKALHNLGNVRESLVDAALDQTKGRLAGMRTDSAYPNVLLRLVEEAVSELRESLQKPWEPSSC